MAMRDANDRGFECVLLEDCTGATDEGNYRAALKMVTMQGGVFGVVGSSVRLLESLQRGGRDAQREAHEFVRGV